MFINAKSFNKKLEREKKQKDKQKIKFLKNRIKEYFNSARYPDASISFHLDEFEYSYFKEKIYPTLIRKEYTIKEQLYKYDYENSRIIEVFWKEEI